MNDKKMNKEIGIIGTSIWQQNMPLLERLTIDRDAREVTLHSLKKKLDLEELIYLSTCNRVEFIYVSSGRYNDRQILHRIIDFFVQGKESISFFPNDFYQFSGKEAILHLFRTTSSLESLVVGETQITGQFKEAFTQCQEWNLIGPALEHLAQEALLTARKVKRETNIGSGALSMASLAASELLKKMNDRLQPVVALVGSGPMTEKMAKYFEADQAIKLLFVNRTLAKAEKLAARFGGRSVSLEQFKAEPGYLDGIISATACTDPIFESEFIDLLQIKTKKVVCIDLAIPRDFSDDFIVDERVELIDIPALKSLEQGNRRQKFAEASRANEIVRDAVDQYLANRIEVSLKPIFRDSYEESVEMARRALEELFAKKVTSIDEKDKQAVIHLVTKLIGQSAFQPVRKLSDRLVKMRSEIKLDETLADDSQRDASQGNRRQAV